MSIVQGFVHLYHVWALFGCVSAVLFGRMAYRDWVRGGGTWRQAPCEVAHVAVWFTTEMFFDVFRLIKHMALSMISVPYIWREGKWSGPVYSTGHTILIGITFGGIARVLTALYWSEKNKAWMEHLSNHEIMMASVPIVLAIIGDVYHHFTAWPDALHRARLLLLTGLLWITYGLLG